MTLSSSALRALAALTSLLPAAPAAAQHGGFVATLGTDTVHVERFERRGDTLQGVIVTRVPTTRVISYTLEFKGGKPWHYTVATVTANGDPIVTPGSAGAMGFVGDSIFRQAVQRDSTMQTQRMAATQLTVPGPSIPYIGVSYLMYEIAFAEARTRANPAGESTIATLTMLPNQPAPQRTQVWFVGADSAELNYFGVARSGYKFDAQGRLIRADWTQTTYRYKITRVADIDPLALAKGWSAADARGNGFGALSPRDTARGAVGTAQFLVDYSRPSSRGRRVWGDVVTWDKVWRLGADRATHFTTSADLRIGNVDVPAGSYTLWLLPSEKGQSMLVVNSQTNIWGTAYQPSRDFARIPVTRSALSPPVEKLTIAIEGGALWIRWDDAAWSVPVVVKASPTERSPS